MPLQALRHPLARRFSLAMLGVMFVLPKSHPMSALSCFAALGLSLRVRKEGPAGKAMVLKRALPPPRPQS